MDFPWIPLFFNFLMLGIVLFVCRTVNAANGKQAWNGALIYFVFCLLAIVLDFTLTMVFASASFHAHTQYEGLASRTAWSERILGYLIPCAVSLVLAFWFHRRQPVLGSRGAKASSTEASPGQMPAAPYVRSKATT